MIVGHAAIAFLLVAGIAVLVDHDHPVTLGAVAAAAAMAPDVDIVTGLLGLPHAELSLGGLSGSYAAAADPTHRGVTHTHAAAGLGAVAAMLGTASRSRRLRYPAGLAAVAAVTALQPTVPTLLVATAFVGLCAGIGAVAARTTPLDAGEVGATAFLALLTHPFGDVFAGDPPRVFAPLSDAPLLAEITPLAATNVDHTLLSLGVEFGLVWASLLLAASLADRAVRPWVGVGCGALVVATAAVVSLPRLQYYEVAGLFAAIAAGVAVASWLVHRRDSPLRSGVRAGLDTLAALSLVVWAMVVHACLGGCL